MATHQSSKDTHIEQQADTQIPKTPKPKNLGGNLAQAIFQHYPEPTLGDEVAAESTRWLLVSPYPEHEHLLNLTSLDTPNRLLALAAVEMEPATEKYATVKYEEAIDWSSLMFTLKSLAAQEGYRWTRHEFYVVEFRSKLKKSIDSDLLFKLDKESHIEATASGGLLKYWYGIPDVDRRNLATCEYLRSD